jgi:hypothetical protein
MGGGVFYAPQQYTSKKNDFLFGIVFGLHYVPFACGSGKIGCASTIHKQKKLIFCLALCSACTIFACLTLSN